MALWETKLFAISQVTGKLEEFTGSFIEANDLVEAHQYLRESGMDYLQLTGTSFKDLETLQRQSHFYETLEQEGVKISDMTLNEFFDWLSDAMTLEDLHAAKERIEQEGITDYLPLINKQIKEYEKRDSQKGSEEDN